MSVSVPKWLRVVALMSIERISRVTRFQHLQRFVPQTRDRASLELPTLVSPSVVSPGVAPGGSIRGSGLRIGAGGRLMTSPHLRRLLGATALCTTCLFALSSSAEYYLNTATRIKGTGVSDDGSLVIGNTDPLDGGTTSHAMIWSDPSGFSPVGDISRGILFKLDAQGISGDGSVITGTANNSIFESVTTGNRAYGPVRAAFRIWVRWARTTQPVLAFRPMAASLWADLMTGAGACGPCAGPLQTA